jgi:hypothetical protein
MVFYSFAIIDVCSKWAPYSYTKLSVYVNPLIYIYYCTRIGGLWGLEIIYNCIINAYKGCVTFYTLMRPIFVLLSLGLSSAYSIVYGLCNFLASL